MLAEVFLKRREAKGRAEGRSEGRAEGLAEGLEEGIEKGLGQGRSEERQQIASRFEGMTPDERLDEIERLIAEARREDRNGTE